MQLICKIEGHVRDVGVNASSGEAPEDASDSDTQKVMCPSAVARSAVSGQRVRIAALLCRTIFLTL